jgi:hypothetical protein
MFYYSRDRGGEHPARHLAGYAGILQADAYSGYTRLYEADRRPGPIIEAGCWVHAPRPFFVLADVEANARRKAQGKTVAVISPLALEAVRRIEQARMEDTSAATGTLSTMTGSPTTSLITLPISPYNATPTRRSTLVRMTKTWYTRSMRQSPS